MTANSPAMYELRVTDVRTTLVSPARDAVLEFVEQFWDWVSKCWRYNITQGWRRQSIPASSWVNRLSAWIVSKMTFYVCVFKSKLPVPLCRYTVTGVRLHSLETLPEVVEQVSWWVSCLEWACVARDQQAPYFFEGFDSPPDMSIAKGVWEKEYYLVGGSASFEINSFFAKTRNLCKRVQKLKNGIKASESESPNGIRRRKMIKRICPHLSVKRNTTYTTPWWTKCFLPLTINDERWRSQIIWGYLVCNDVDLNVLNRATSSMFT